MSTAVAAETKTGTKPSQLEQLKKFTVIVADTADCLYFHDLAVAPAAASTLATSALCAE